LTCFCYTHSADPFHLPFQPAILIHTPANATFMLTSVQGHVSLRHNSGILEVSSTIRLCSVAQTILPVQDQTQWQETRLYGT
jgi:hypothetical protein